MDTSNHLKGVLENLGVDENDFLKLKQDLENIVTGEIDFNLKEIIKILEGSIDIKTEKDEVLNSIKKALFKSTLKDGVISVLQKNLKETKRKLEKANREIIELEALLEERKNYKLKSL